MKNCVEKKMGKKNERRWNNWFVGAFVFANATNIVARRRLRSVRKEGKEKKGGNTVRKRAELAG